MVVPRVDERSLKTETRRRPISAIRRWLTVHRPSSFVLLAALLLAMPVGCSPATSREADSIGVGAPTPALIVQTFLEQLNEALKDPQLANPDVRRAWAARLASYFAPNEREDQRAALGAALAGLVSGVRQLEPDEKLTLELSDTIRVDVGPADGDMVLVRPVNVSLTLRIERATPRGTTVELEQQVPLEKLVGRPDGAIPTIQINDRWFLTEG